MCGASVHDATHDTAHDAAIHLWSASKTCYWNFVQTLKVEMKCKHILMFPAVLTSANITSSLYYLLVNLKWCFQTNPKAKTRNTLPFIPNNQEAGHAFFIPTTGYVNELRHMWKDMKEGQWWPSFFCVVCPAKLDHTCRCKSGHGNRQWAV